MEKEELKSKKGKRNYKAKTREEELQETSKGLRFASVRG
jgi:hypothetical protein